MSIDVTIIHEGLTLLLQNKKNKLQTITLVPPIYGTIPDLQVAKKYYADIGDAIKEVEETELVLQEATKNLPSKIAVK